MIISCFMNFLTTNINLYCNKYKQIKTCITKYKNINLSCECNQCWIKFPAFKKGEGSAALLQGGHLGFDGGDDDDGDGGDGGSEIFTTPGSTGCPGVGQIRMSGCSGG